jgi:hypothetical protein
MKMKNITLLSIGLGLLMSPAIAQDQGGNGPGHADDRPSDPARIGGGGQVPEELREMRGDLQDLRSEIRDSRQAVLTGLDPEATPAERRAALADWQAANADRIAEAELLAETLRAAIQENRPGERPDRPERPERPNVPEEIAEKQAERNSLQSQLAEARAALIAQLRAEGADADAVAAAMATLREENADLIAQIQGLGQEISTWAQSQRPDRGVRPQNTEMDERRAEFAQNAREMREARANLGQQMRGPMDPEERQALIEEFRQNQRELMEEQKELRRQQRSGGGDDLGGDRRPGE